MRRVRRLRALSLATIFVAGQLAGFAHNLLVSHTTCSEHGEVIHESSAAGHAAPTAAHRVTPSGAPAVHEHDVCLVAMLRREHATAAVATTVELPTPLALRHARPSLGVPPPRSIDLYRLAPKNSPPA